MAIESTLKSLLQKLPRGAVLLASVSLINVVLGFAREATIAYFFGASAEVDEFLVGLALPRFLVTNVAMISVAVVLPVYVGYREKGEPERATELVRRWFWFSGKVMAVVCAVLFAGAELIMHALAPGFDAAQKAEAARWLRILLPYVWMMSVAGAFKVVLDTHRRFLAPALAKGLVSACVIAACALASSAWGAGALAAGFVAGGMVGFSVQFLSSRRLEPRIPFSLSRQKLSLPLAAGGAMLLQSVSSQGQVFIDRGFASTLPEGSVAAYNYAQAINSLPNAVVSSAIATALFPILSRMISKGDAGKAFIMARKWVLIIVCAALVPVFLLIFFRFEIVELLFERGSFDLIDVNMTASVLQFLPIVMLTTGSTVILNRLLLSHNRAFWIAILGVTAVVLKFVFSFFLVKYLGLRGLALATVLVAVPISFTRYFLCLRIQKAS